MVENATVAVEPKPVRVRNRRGEGARLRADIVAAAVELLDEACDDGAVTLRAVARRVGIAAPSIYRHFPDQPSIVLAVVRQAFGDLEERLRASRATAGADPRRRLLAIGHAYLEFADRHPGRYRTMFGGSWTSNPSEGDPSSLGSASTALLVDALGACVEAGASTSDDVAADGVALWLGLHGLAHQKTVSADYPWPADIAERVITALGRLA